MPKLYLVRHAKPVAGWGQDPGDPGLDDTGVAQAEAVTQELGAKLAPLPLYTSPMRRCQETAAPLVRLWKQPAHLFHALAEIPSPPLPIAARHAWLTAAMQGTWAELQAGAPPGSPDFLAWRRELLAALSGIRGDSVIFSHFIAINAVIGAVQASDALVSFRPDHASVTVVETVGPKFRIVTLGREADTSVLTRG